jgi:aquaporin Z
MMKKLLAEVIGTFLLVSTFCAAGAMGLPGLPYGFVALCGGMAVMVMAYAVGHVSGGHFNPAVTCGLVAAGRHSPAEAIQYIVAQVIGACLAGFVWYTIASTNGAAAATLGNFASNGFGDAGSPGKYGLGAAALAEVVATALFVFIIVGATSKGAPAGMAPVAIGFALFVFLLMLIPITNGSLNPARSTGTALFGGAVPLQQLWLFWVAPIVGGVIGGLVARYVQSED